LISGPQGDVRTGLVFGAVVYSVTGDLDFAEIVNGLASCAAGNRVGPERDVRDPEPCSALAAPS
jgi:hypothetical protein